jgi:steroid delta-isomerase-like uncharacterized protein
VSAEDNKARFRRLFDEMFNKGNLAAAEEAFAPNLVFHSPTQPEPIRGIEGFKEFPAMLRTGFPDIDITIEDLIGEGGFLMSRWTWRGTHLGPFLGIPPTGKQATGRGMEIYRFAGDKIEEIWLEVDPLGMLQQLGIFPKGGIPRPVLWLVGRLQRLRAGPSMG